MSDGAFANLDDKLNVDFKPDSQEISATLLELKQEIEVMEEKKNSLVAIKDNPMMMQDQEYMRGELKDLLIDSRTILNKLSQNIKVGSAPRDYEAYAKMVSSISTLIKELRELNRGVIELKIQSGKLDSNILNKKISLTADQLLTMIDKAKQGSQLKDIDAHFTIMDEKDA